MWVDNFCQVRANGCSGSVWKTLYGSRSLNRNWVAIMFGNHDIWHVANPLHSPRVMQTPNPQSDFLQLVTIMSYGSRPKNDLDRTPTRIEPVGVRKPILKLLTLISIKKDDKKCQRRKSNFCMSIICLTDAVLVQHPGPCLSSACPLPSHVR